MTVSPMAGVYLMHVMVFRLNSNSAQKPFDYTDYLGIPPDCQLHVGLAGFAASSRSAVQLGRH